MTDEWQTQGGKILGALTSFHHRNWCYFEGDKILIYYIAGSCPLFIWRRGVCLGGEGVQSLHWDPLITDSQSLDLVYLDIAISFLSCIRQGRKCSI